MKIHYLPGRICTTEAIRQIANDSQEPYTMISTKPSIRWVNYAIERMMQIAEDTGAYMVYADHFNETRDAAGEAIITNAPVIDYQYGALRDDFDFGAITLWRTEVLKKAVAAMDNEYKYAGFYDLRLRVSRMKEAGQSDVLVHIPEYLYYEVEEDTRKSGEKLFDYVNPANRDVQIEMEACEREHLNAIGALLTTEMYTKQLPAGGNYEITASVVIPCKNRANTIGDAIKSALSQKVKEGYIYNVIVVDDNSSDGTAEIIKEALQQNQKEREQDKSKAELIYIAQDKTWHAIGGNWNAAIHNNKCGRIAIQLDSDDTYYDETTVQQFIEAFYPDGADWKKGNAKYGMVIGSYQLTDMTGNPLPPGKIDHKEWTDANGMNNALRINGLGAPRAFDTSLLKEINFPTTKYGEDYAVGLRICREYRIGRIWNVLYNCRRWEGNSDANCDIEAMNRNNWYKDRIRTWELEARLKMKKDYHF